MTAYLMFFYYPKLKLLYDGKKYFEVFVRVRNHDMGNKKFVWVSKNSHKKCLWNENEKEILLPMLCNTFIPTQNNQIVFVWNWVILESRGKNWQLPDIAWRFREMKFSWVQRFHFIYSTQLQEITCLDSNN